jgi:hypothetical protein
LAGMSSILVTIFIDISLWPSGMFIDKSQSVLEQVLSGVFQPLISICSPSGPLKTTRRQPLSFGSLASVG